MHINQHHPIHSIHQSRLASTGEDGAAQLHPDVAQARSHRASVVINSVNGAGFAAGHSDWFIACHDVYGCLFDERYNGATPFNFGELDDALNDVGTVTDE
jgi:hypothetical protein